MGPTGMHGGPWGTGPLEEREGAGATQHALWEAVIGPRTGRGRDHTEAAGGVRRDCALSPRRPSTRCPASCREAGPQPQGTRRTLWTTTAPRRARPSRSQGLEMTGPDCRAGFQSHVLNPGATLRSLCPRPARISRHTGTWRLWVSQPVRKRRAWAPRQQGGPAASSDPCAQGFRGQGVQFLRRSWVHEEIW